MVSSSYCLPIIGYVSLNASSIKEINFLLVKIILKVFRSKIMTWTYPSDYFKIIFRNFNIFRRSSFMFTPECLNIITHQQFRMHSLSASTRWKDRHV